MERTFGRELTNLPDSHLPPQRNSSFLHPRNHHHSKDAKPVLSGRNRSLLMPSAKQSEQRVAKADLQMVPEYL